MAASRRDNETRTSTERSKSWKPASLLPVPDAEEGKSYRWVRVSSRGVPDNKNISSRMREGWEPVNVKDHPELHVMSDQDSRYQDGVEIGGLLLCQTSTEVVKARSRYFTDRARDQITTVDNNMMRESDPRMPMLAPERRSRTTVGNGKFGSGSSEE